jgi:outer membrane protein OmpA-like peptidoglycan-associated protein
MNNFSFKAILVALALCVLAPAESSGQAVDTAGQPWYVSVGGGTSFGQCTFRSITEHQIHWGLQGAVSGGYRFNPLVSLEAGVQFGGQSQYALDCCPYWLSDAEVRYLSPVIGQTGWPYTDLRAASKWGKLAFQANFDLLSLVIGPDSRWSLLASPQVSAVTTKTTLVTPDKKIAHDRQWHFGLGGQSSIGYRINDKISAALYGGITCLTGRRFDNMPEHGHISNLIWDAGIKLSFGFGGSKKVKPVGSAPVAKEVAEPYFGKPSTVVPSEVKEPAEEVQPAEEVKPAEKQEAAEKAAAEKAAAEKEAAFQTPIPTVYFLNNSSRMDEASGASLQEALSILNKYPDFELEIHAYASKVGTKEYNRKISKERMEEVRNWFVNHGIGEERIGRAYFHGVDYDAPSDAEARRAELKFVK